MLIKTLLASAVLCATALAGAVPANAAAGGQSSPSSSHQSASRANDARIAYAEVYGINTSQKTWVHWYNRRKGYEDGGIAGRPQPNETFSYDEPVPATPGIYFLGFWATSNPIDNRQKIPELGCRLIAPDGHVVSDTVTKNSASISCPYVQE